MRLALSILHSAVILRQAQDEVLTLSLSKGESRRLKAAGQVAAPFILWTF